MRLAHGVSDGCKLVGYLALIDQFATMECGTSETPVFCAGSNSSAFVRTWTAFKADHDVEWTAGAHSYSFWLRPICPDEMERNEFRFTKGRLEEAAHARFSIATSADGV